MTAERLNDEGGKRAASKENLSTETQSKKDHFERTVRNVSDWRSANKCLPGKTCDVLVVAKDDGKMQIVTYSSRHRAFRANDEAESAERQLSVTYWMPLPEPPKEGTPCMKE